MACSCSLIPSLKLASTACKTLSGAGKIHKATVFLPSVLSPGSQAASFGSCRFQLASLKGSSREVATSRARRENMSAQASTTAAPADSLHDFVVEDIDGQEVSLSKYKGKVALVVNVASACGLTVSNYTELTEVYNKYKDQNFVILAFPCNQFGGQEPGGPEQIKEFACSRYKAEFPLFSKIDVNGANAAPVYKWLKSKKGGGLMGEGIKWNFGKFLVDQNGKVVERYMPTTSPKSIEKDIQKLLAV